ncbi:MAG: hypothetical protein ABSG02_14690 [Terriglobales bacterium]
MDEATLRACIENLGSRLVSLHHWSDLWTVLVVVGVAFEVIVLIVVYLAERHDFRRGFVHAPDKPSFKLLLFELFGVVLVTGGIMGELVVGMKVQHIEVQLAQANEDLINLVESTALSRADQLRTTLDNSIATGKETIATLRDEEKKASTELARDIEIQSTRWALLEKHAPELRNQLRRFPRQTVWTFICGASNSSNGIPATDEAIETARVLTGSILGKTGAGWGLAKGYKEADAFRPNLAAGFWGDCEAQMALLQMPLFRGLKIFVNAQGPKNTLAAATELDRALSNTFPFPSSNGLLVVDVEEGRVMVDGKRVEANFRPSYQVVRDPSAIVVLIGAHPQKR